MPNSERHSILILRPSREVLGLTKKIADQLGYPLVIARHGAEALRKAEKQPLRLFMFHIQDPVKDCALYLKIKKAWPNCEGLAFFSKSLLGDFPLFKARVYPDHLIPEKFPEEIPDLQVTMLKILSNDIFGIEKYGIKPKKVRLQSSLQKAGILEKIQAFYLSKKVPVRILQKAGLVLDELVMNAIFDAPVNGRGKRVYYGRKRDSVIGLKKHECPQIAYGFRKGVLALSVTDPFGTFEKSSFFSVIQRLRVKRSIKEGAGKGAGMGLFMTFRAVDELIVNVDPGKRTEFIALLRLKAPLGSHGQRSLHFFQCRSP